MTRLKKHREAIFDELRPRLGTLLGNHPEEFDQLKEMSEPAYLSIMMSYGLGEYSRSRDGAIAKKIREQGHSMTVKRVHTLKKVGLCILLGPNARTDFGRSVKAKAETLKHQYHQRKKEEERIMESQKEVREWLRKNIDPAKLAVLREQADFYRQVKGIDLPLYPIIDKFFSGHDLSGIDCGLEKKETERQLRIACILLGYSPKEEDWSPEINQTVNDIQTVWVEELKKREGEAQMARKITQQSATEAPQEIPTVKTLGASSAVAPAPTLAPKELPEVTLSDFYVKAWSFVFELLLKQNAEIKDNAVVLSGSYLPLFKAWVKDNYPRVQTKKGNQDYRYRWDTFIRKRVVSQIWPEGKPRGTRPIGYLITDPNQFSINKIENSPELRSWLRLEEVSQPAVTPAPAETPKSKTKKAAKIKTPSLKEAERGEVIVGLVTGLQTEIKRLDDKINVMEKELAVHKARRVRLGKALELQEETLKVLQQC